MKSGTIIAAVVGVLAASAPRAAALYSKKDAVVSVDSKSFSSEVTKFPGVVAVEFYAPWCGHCKNLAPEWKKAAKMLEGVAKVVAVDASADQSLAGRFGVQGFPTIKIFGANKKKPTDYNGQRTASAIVSAVMKEVAGLVGARGGPKASSSSSSGSRKSSSGRGSSDSSQPGGGKNVVTLTAANFDELVLGSEDAWMVEFYAPWCGHCKSLAPEWAGAADAVDGDVKFGAVDATAEEALGSRFGIRGFPTIKFFPAGARSDSEARDYNGQREAGPIAEWALSTAGASSTASAAEELLSQAQWDKTCKGKRICVVAFLPHISTDGKATREGRIATLTAVAKAERAPMFRFLWTSEAQQIAMEEAFGVQGNLPAVVAVSPSKKAFAVHRGRTDQEGIGSFVKGLVSGRVRPAKAKGSLPAVVTAEPWDGEDAVEEEEDDIDLAELLGDEL